MLTATLPPPPLTEQQQHHVLDKTVVKDDNGYGFLELEEEDASGDTVLADSDLDEMTTTDKNPIVIPSTLHNSIRHVDSYVSFVKHCEYQHSHPESSDADTALLTTTSGDKTEDHPQPSKDQPRRRVQFVQPDDQLFVVHDIPAVVQEDRQAVWLTEADFERQEKEVQMTLWRWENHLSGAVPFDEVNNSIRGLEHLIKDMVPAPKATKSRPTGGKGGKHRKAPVKPPVSVTKTSSSSPPQPSTKRLHRQAIKAELQRQKQAYAADPNRSPCFVVNHEQLRAVSEQASRQDLEKVIRVGQEDAQAALDAWKTNQDVAAQPILPATTQKKKGNGLKFWKRK